MFFTFFKLYNWHQIAQNITYDMTTSSITNSFCDFYFISLYFFLFLFFFFFFFSSFKKCYLKAKLIFNLECYVSNDLRVLHTAHKMKFSIKEFFSKCGLFTFTEEILSEKLSFLPVNPVFHFYTHWKRIIKSNKSKSFHIAGSLSDSKEKVA